MSTERHNPSQPPLVRGGAEGSLPDKGGVRIESNNTPHHGLVLLPIARAAIASVFSLSHAADETAPWLAEHGACFVTLTQRGELRGCIGTLQAHRPLLADVKGNAVAAALYDPRFAPLSLAELDITEVEISLLSSTQPMDVRDEADALAQLRPGIDGVIFEYSSFRSTFLPQVWSQLPQPHQFLDQLKRKAGLPGKFWADEVKLSRYTVTKWRESDFTDLTGKQNE